MQISSEEIMCIIRANIQTWVDTGEKLKHKSASDTAYYAGAIAALNHLSIEINRQVQERTKANENP